MNSKYISKIITAFILLPLFHSHSFAQGIRKHYEEMTNDERDAIVDAYWLEGGSTGTTGLNSEIANFHNSNFNDIHFNNQTDDVFFAWHRQTSHELERAMKNDLNNEWITIPYWDWTISNSKSDPLWGNDWLGPFNTAWSLNRSPSSSQTLPTQSDINNALTESNFFPFSRWEVESSALHVRGHTWTGGIMTSGNSPKDPVFFFHHNMIDKIWADWYEIHGDPSADYYIKTDMPRFPNVDPDDIVDPRSLGIFYAEDQLATLDKYTVSNTYTSSEKFGYQYAIEVMDNFIVPTNKDAELRSCSNITLLPGFVADNGSVFNAKVDSDCNFSTAQRLANEQKQAKANSRTRHDNKDNWLTTKIKNYPNPFSTHTTFEFELQESTTVHLAIYDITGKFIAVLIDNKDMESGSHTKDFDAQTIPEGIYIYRLSTEYESISQKMILKR